MRTAILIIALLCSGCASRQTCFSACLQRRTQQEPVVIVREIDGRLHALIDRRGQWIDPWTMKPYNRPVELLCQLRPEDLR